MPHGASDAKVVKCPVCNETDFYMPHETYKFHLAHYAIHSLDEIVQRHQAKQAPPTKQNKD